jgi:glycosyltransferase involved in cell wall biosynthesis
MQLLYITPYVPSPIRVRPYELLRALVAQGVRPTLLCPAAPADASAIAELRDWGLHVVPVTVTLRQRIPALVHGALEGQPLQAAYGAPQTLRRQLHALLDGRSFDLVHIEHVRAAALLPLTTRLPVVYDAVDCISTLLKHTRQQGPNWRSRTIAALEQERTRRFERLVCSQAQVTVVTSSKDQADLEALAPGATIKVVPNGVDGARFAAATTGRAENVIVFSGKMSYHANIAAAQRLVERIMPLVWARRPEAQLWIVGSAPPRSIQRYAADPRIVVTGRVPEIAPYLQGATVAASPLCYGVGVQNKVLEALATATPVVADRQCLAALEAQPGRDVLTADDDDGFAARIVELLQDAELRQRLGAAGRAYIARTHRWTNSAMLLLEAYQQALQSRNVPIPPTPLGSPGARPELRRHV